MTPTQTQQERIRRYLLGELSDGAGEEIERELLINEDLFEEILVTEAELTDEYIEGKLAAEERTHFEQHFLATPERQQDLRFARALNRYVTNAGGEQDILPVKVAPGFWSTRTFLFRATAAIVAVIAIVAVGWLGLRHRTSPPANFATLNLVIGVSERGQGTPPSAAKLPRDADGLRILMRVPDQSLPAVGYRVEVANESGQSKSYAATAVDRQSISVVIPAAELKRGLNSVKVFTVNADGKEQRLPGNGSFVVE
jgi:hypothetical protein